MLMHCVFLSDKDSSSWIRKYYSVAVCHWKPLFLFHAILRVPWTEKQNARRNPYSRCTNQALEQDPLTPCLLHVFPSRSHQDTSSKFIWNCYEESTAASSLSHQGQPLCFPGYLESQNPVCVFLWLRSETKDFSCRSTMKHDRMWLSEYWIRFLGKLPVWNHCIFIEFDATCRDKIVNDYISLLW